MPTYTFKCQECGDRIEQIMPITEFSREMELRCDGCGRETPHRSVPTGGKFSCKGTGFPSTNHRLKQERNKKSSQKKQIMVNREKSGEGVSKLDDLKKPMR